MIKGRFVGCISHFTTRFLWKIREEDMSHPVQTLVSLKSESPPAYSPLDIHKVLFYWRLPKCILSNMQSWRIAASVLFCRPPMHTKRLSGSSYHPEHFRKAKRENQKWIGRRSFGAPIGEFYISKRCHSYKHFISRVTIIVEKPGVSLRQWV